MYFIAANHIDSSWPARIFPVAHRVSTSPTPSPPARPPGQLITRVDKELSSFQDCLTPHAWSAIISIHSDIATDGHDTRNKLSNHRLRRNAGKPQQHTRIGVEHYTPLVKDVLLPGFTLAFLPSGKPCIAHLLPSPASDWGFNNARLARDAESISWPDKELIHSLHFGFPDYSASTPPMTWLDPHSNTAYKSWPSFSANTNSEIGNGWIVGHWSHPPTIPCRVLSGATILKRQPLQSRCLSRTTHTHLIQFQLFPP